MNIAVISYSFTGNNEALAAGVAKALNAEHIKIAEPKTRTYGTIMADILFGRTPKVLPEPEIIDKYEGVVFVAPVWMEMPAFPLRAYLKHLRKSPKKFGFVSISGGSIKPNPKLRGNIEKMAGNAPAAYLDMHIVDLLPKDVKIEPKSVMNYKLTASDLDLLTAKAKEEILRYFG